MAIMIKEYVGHKGLEVKWDYKDKAALCTQESDSSIKPSTDSLLVVHEALHVGPTRNFTWYLDEALEDSVSTWTYPYLRPVIKNHDEENGDTIGRIVEASYGKKSSLSKTGYLSLTAMIPGKKEKESVKNGLLSTVSIGAIIHGARCSICNQEIATDGPCEHERGEEYDGKICYWMIYKMEAKELSYVNVPSDKYAQVTSFKESSEKQSLELTESMKSMKGDSKMENILEKDENTAKEQVMIKEEAQSKEETSKEDVTIETTSTEEKNIEKEQQENETDSNKECNEKIEELTNLVNQLKVELDALKDQYTQKEEELKKEVATREALENQLIELQESEKASIIDRVIATKEKLGLSSDKEKLQTKTLSFLKESLSDLEEELSIKETSIQESAKVEIPQQVESPAVVQEQKKTTKTVSMAEKMEQDLMSMLSEAMNPKKY